MLKKSKRREKVKWAYGCNMAIKVHGASFQKAAFKNFQQFFGMLNWRMTWGIVWIRPKSQSSKSFIRLYIWWRVKILIVYKVQDKPEQQHQFLASQNRPTPFDRRFSAARKCRSLKKNSLTSGNSFGKGQPFFPLYFSSIHNIMTTDTNTEQISTLKEQGHVPVGKGRDAEPVNLYYEIHGSGAEKVLLVMGKRSILLCYMTGY